MRATSSKYSIGVDYGTNSVRAVVFALEDGAEIASGVFAYPTGVDGVIVSASDPQLARQNPADYIEGFFTSVSEALKKASKADRKFKPENVAGIGVDTTGSTPIPVGKDGMPLSFDRKFKDNPNAYAWLWKDHTAYAEAEAIADPAREMNMPYLDKCGGKYSSE